MAWGPARDAIKAAFGTLGTLLLISTAAAQVMTSPSYQIESDSLNTGGGFSTSTSYRLESTVGEAATGDSTSTSYRLRAGYQSMHEVYLALTGATNVTMGPSIPGVSGGTANGSTTVTVTTDSRSGYSLTIAAAQSPAMRSGANTIADYQPASSTADFTFTTNAADAHFGFTIEGIDTAPRFKDNGTSCGSGSQNALLACWDGVSTTPLTIATAGGSNHPSGATTSIRFRVGAGSAVVQPEGSYVATTTLTALPL